MAKDFAGLPAWICKTVGGTTTHWAGASLRFDEHEFKDKTTYGNIPGARFEIVEHDGTYRDILAATGVLTELAAEVENVKEAIDALAKKVNRTAVAAQEADTLLGGTVSEVLDRLGALERIRPDPDGCADAQPPLVVLRRVGELDLLLDVLSLWKYWNKKSPS